MQIEISIIHGLVFGFEFMEDSDEQGEFSILAVHLPLFRLCFIW